MITDWPIKCSCCGHDIPDKRFDGPTGGCYNCLVLQCESHSGKEQSNE